MFGPNRLYSPLQLLNHTRFLDYYLESIFKKVLVENDSYFLLKAQK